MFNIENRRYVGSKAKLMPWIEEKITENCTNCDSLFDVFAGTGVVTASLFHRFSTFIVNDFLFSNEIIYKGFMGPGAYSLPKLQKIAEELDSTDAEALEPNYISDNFGGKYFSFEDAKKIGFIRQSLEEKRSRKDVSGKEYCILLASLLYSCDRIANTCGHYDAYIKGKPIRSEFTFSLIAPMQTAGKTVMIQRTDANALARSVSADVAFIDPPYNSRQYSRFYHVLENITKWEMPALYGTAMKPKEENMSDYCKTSAPAAFADLIENLDVKYIVVTYNNTYNSKSGSSQNKITLEEIRQILESKGTTSVYEKPYRFFNAGKTDLADHKEFLFITKVDK